MYDYQTGPSAGLGMIPLLAMLGVYLYFAYCQVRMAQKIGLHDCAWYAWIPVMNAFLLVRMAGKPTWWLVLCLVPLANIVCFAILWMEVAKALKTSPAWGILMLIPGLNLLAAGMMAFSESPAPAIPPLNEETRHPEHVG